LSIFTPDRDATHARFRRYEPDRDHPLNIDITTVLNIGFQKLNLTNSTRTIKRNAYTDFVKTQSISGGSSPTEVGVQCSRTLVVLTVYCCY